MLQICIVEDDHKLREGLCLALKETNINIIPCDTLQKAREAIAQSIPDLVILDVNLPDGSGLDLLAEIKSGPGTPVILLTANDTEMDVVTGLENGADDYITKPFSFKELTARIKANMRRTRPQRAAHEAQDAAGPFSIDRNMQEICKNGKPLELTQREYDIICYFWAAQGRVVSREELMEKVWGYDYYGDLRAIDVAMRRLREKLEDDPANPVYLMTKRGAGYYFNR
jgi:two-component system response regulator VicR